MPAQILHGPGPWPGSLSGQRPLFVDTEALGEKLMAIIINCPGGGGRSSNQEVANSRGLGPVKLHSVQCTPGLYCAPDNWERFFGAKVNFFLLWTSFRETHAIVSFSINHHAFRGQNYMSDITASFLCNCMLNSCITFLLISSVLFNIFSFRFLL